MTLAAFQLLTPRAQLLLALQEGIYLAHRWEEGYVKNLYYLPNSEQGLFAEVGFDNSHECLIILRTVTSSVLLEEYAHDVQLPE
jgi:hypothetical protein